MKRLIIVVALLERGTFSRGSTVIDAVFVDLTVTDRRSATRSAAIRLRR
jgi:hypothetical protein